MRYYARLNPAKLDQQFLNRPEVLRLSDVGAQLGFGLSVLNERGILRDPNLLDANDPVPLLTWPFLDFVECIDFSGQRLLELGAGSSTLWFQRRFAQVRSFETNPEWSQQLKGYLAPHVELTLVDLKALESAEVDYRGEELVVVDFAGHRTRFLGRFLERLSGQRPQAIVLDNADWYRNGAGVLARHGYHEIPFHGFKCGQPHLSCTSLFIDPARFAPRVKEPFHRPAFSRPVDNPWDEP
ncbi:MAG: hypothetical protein K0R38_389 [Polyangiaceae bacterium]|jgi:hypothetical protein|nr:hypothetical protein [Polyangiaceae bacterium]